MPADASVVIPRSGLFLEHTAYNTHATALPPYTQNTSLLSFCGVRCDQPIAFLLLFCL